MHIFITGGLGFVGGRLSEVPLEAGHSVTASGRTKNQAMTDRLRFTDTAVDTTQSGPRQDRVKQADAAVALAGVSIFGLWTEGRKQQFYDRRILTTRNLVKALSGDRAEALCSASAVGFYGSREG